MKSLNKLMCLVEIRILLIKKIKVHKNEEKKMFLKGQKLFLKGQKKVFFNYY